MEHQGRRVAAVDDAYGPVAVREFDEDRGGEALEGVQSVPPGALARQGPLQALRHRLQRRLLLGGLPEGADHDGDGGHRAHALAPHVADDEPDAAGAVLHRVQVAADEGVGLRGLVADGDLETGDALGGFGQHGALGGLGDLADGDEARTGAPDEAVHEDGEHGDRRDGDQLGEGVHVVDDALGELQPDDRDDDGDAREHRAAPRVDRRDDQGRGRVEGAGGEVPRGEDVVQDGDDDQQHGKREHEGPPVPGPAARRRGGGRRVVAEAGIGRGVAGEPAAGSGDRSLVVHVTWPHHSSPATPHVRVPLAVQESRFPAAGAGGERWGADRMTDTPGRGMHRGPEPFRIPALGLQ